MRTLRPSRQDIGEAANQLRRHVRLGLGGRCQRAANTFKTGTAALLFRPLQPELREGFDDNLSSIFSDAGDLAMQLWTQRPGIAIRSMQEIAGERFAVASHVMQAHPLHKLDDPDDTRLDGRRIVLAVHPAVLRTGTHDAEDYHYETVWAKSVVWLGT